MSVPAIGNPPVLVPPTHGGGGVIVTELGKEPRHPPQDGVSSLRFSRHIDRLLVSSWDKTVRLYDAESNKHMWMFTHMRPVLYCCFHDDSSGFGTGSDQTVWRVVL